MSRTEESLNFWSALVVVLYALFVLSLPLTIDVAPAAVALGLWLGGSFVAGLFAPLRFLVFLPVAALAIHTVVYFSSPIDTEFLSDPFTIIGLTTLTAGEMAAVFAGSRARDSLSAKTT
jgi:hypothetical protein